MNDGQARYFADQLMPFGKYKGEWIGNVPLSYLDWLVDAPDEFKNQLRAYLKNEKVAERLRIELEQDAPWNQT